jgi:hypothetical protein
MEHLFLTRRNLPILLSKLDRKKAGEDTACTIVKYDNPHGIYTQSMPEIMIRAVEDDEYYMLANLALCMKKIFLLPKFPQPTIYPNTQEITCPQP